jgi:hypothetical protein
MAALPEGPDILLRCLLFIALVFLSGQEYHATS